MQFLVGFDASEGAVELADDGPAVREVLLHQSLRLLRRGSRE